MTAQQHNQQAVLSEAMAACPAVHGGRRVLWAVAAWLALSLGGCNRSCDQLADRLCEAASASGDKNADGQCEAWRARSARVSPATCEAALQRMDQQR